MNKTLSLFLSLAILLTTNINAQCLETELQNLLKTDINFSEFSVKHGINKAFIEFADDSAVLLKPNRMPVIGKAAIQDYHSKIDDTKFILSWKPLKGNISESADLGYTYGIWRLTADNVLTEGTYVSIWKKNRCGEWKYILDSGNEGLGIMKE